MTPTADATTVTSFTVREWRYEWARLPLTEKDRYQPYGVGGEDEYIAEKVRELVEPPLRQHEPTHLPDPWLEVVIPARYGGCYEGARFVAFYVDPDAEWVPEDAIGPDPAASAWWGSPAADLVGRGASPNEALADLKRRRPEVGG